MIPEDNVLNLSMSVEDAFKIIISGGIVSPNPSNQVPLATPKERQLDKYLSEGR